MIFDEPTSALSPEEVDHLFALIRRLRNEGVAIVYITHRLNEVPEIADEVVVFRDGNLVASGPIADFPHDRIVEAMTGEVYLAFEHHDIVKIEASGLRPALKVTAASMPPLFQDITLEVYKGEIIGLFGRLGCGALEVGEALFGLRPWPAARSRLWTGTASPKDLRRPKNAGWGSCLWIARSRDCCQRCLYRRT